MLIESIVEGGIMLSKHTIEIVKSTVPLLVNNGEQITKQFYEMLFEAHPELKNIFNANNQRDGQQARALADAIFAYANNIDHLEVLIPAVQRIANKHISLGVQAEHYPIVGQYLLMAVQQVLTLPDEHPALIAWSEAYDALARVFIETEQGLYDQKEQMEGGWLGLRGFVVDRIEMETATVRSFYLTPKDGLALPHYSGGQFISVNVSPTNSDYQQIRQYSLSGPSNGKDFRITTKRESQGLVSCYLHELNVGDELNIQVPAGIFTLSDSAKKHVFIASGVGITPLMSMLYQAIGEGVKSEDLLFIQSQQDEASQIFKHELQDMVASEQLNYKCNYLHSEEGDHCGYINATLIGQWFDEANMSVDEQLAVYICGAKSFMSSIKQQCLELGISESALHYEVFGPTTAI
jgi:nitric oxide dioxygenase